uniref:NAC domain-containing protein n=1 Tax=Leersia perrieri TaxID=77586 RepID=A0A0D9W9K4_9ORYZ
MSLISMMEANLPPGFRFHPRDEELVMDYLYPKLTGAGAGAGEQYGGVAMVDVDLNKCEPWELPDAARVGTRVEWYFFSLHDRKYATGQRTNRATASGYWKATGKDRAVFRRRHGVSGEAAAAAAVVGMRKTLVFYQGRAPRGSKTEWVMHEFRVDGPAVADHPSSSPLLLKEDWVLCRVFYKSRTATPRPVSGEAAGVSLSSELSLPPPPPVAPAVVDAYLAVDRAPASDIVAGGYYRPPPELTDFRDLLGNMVNGGGGAKAEGFHLGWSEEEAAGFVQQQQQSAMASQAWNPF